MKRPDRRAAPRGRAAVARARRGGRLPARLPARFGHSRDHVQRWRGQSQGLGTREEAASYLQPFPSPSACLELCPYTPPLHDPNPHLLLLGPSSSPSPLVFLPQVRFIDVKECRQVGEVPYASPRRMDCSFTLDARGNNLALVADGQVGWGVCRVRVMDVQYELIIGISYSSPQVLEADPHIFPLSPALYPCFHLPNYLPTHIHTLLTHPGPSRHCCTTWHPSGGRPPRRPTCRFSGWRCRAWRRPPPLSH